MSQFATILHHKLFTWDEANTSFTILSTGRRIVLSLFVCFLKTISLASITLQAKNGVTKDHLLTKMIYNHCPLLQFALNTLKLESLCFSASSTWNNFCLFGTKTLLHNLPNRSMAHALVVIEIHPNNK